MLEVSAMGQLSVSQFIYADSAWVNGKVCCWAMRLSGSILTHGNAASVIRSRTREVAFIVNVAGYLSQLTTGNGSRIDMARR